MPKRQKTSRRTLDYLTLQWMLLLFILGGLITLNCNPAESIAGGTLQEKEGVSKFKGGGVLFDSAVNNSDAQYTLPATMELFGLGGETYDEPIAWNVDPAHESKDRASISGNTATVNYPAKAEQYVTFEGQYTKPDGTAGYVVHQIKVARF